LSEFNNAPYSKKSDQDNSPSRLTRQTILLQSTPRTRAAICCNMYTEFLTVCVVNVYLLTLIINMKALCILLHFVT